MTTAWLVLQFVACALAIARAGYVLSEAGDALADAYGWGRGWVGLALLATATSLPELASGISAVAFVDAPDIAVGNVLGACLVNLGFLVVVDALQRDQPMYVRASATHLLSAAFGVVMAGFVALSLVGGARLPDAYSVGAFSPLLLGLYLFALRSIHAHERASAAGVLPASRDGVVPDPRRAWRRFGASSAVVLAAGAWLPHVADGLANALGVSRTLVGTLLLGLTTTLPEMAVTLGALRLGALDLAIGNLLGSNLFNLAILAIDDLAYRRGALLHATSGDHLGTALGIVVMSGLVIVGLVMRPRGRLFRVTSWVSVGLVSTWLLAATMLSGTVR